MGSSRPSVVQLPQQSTTSGSTQVTPYAPVEPFIQSVLSPIAQTFSDAPALFGSGLTPADSAQTLAARDIYGQVGDAAAAQAPIYQDLFNRDVALARGDITQDPLHLARTQNIANQARQFTERDKLLAQRQAIDAGQFGLGSTALKEFEANQQIRREDLAQKQLSDSLGQAEARRVSALGRVPGLGQQQLGAQALPATLQEAIGGKVEAKDAAALQDLARLAQQRQEAERAQLVTMSNLFGGLAGLGSQTQLQQRTQGVGSQAYNTVSPINQIAGLVGAGARIGGLG